MKALLTAWISGVLFAIGLGISGMTDPTKVIGFLDVAGAWDPSLALVMAGAIGVHWLPSVLAFRRGTPLLDTRFHLPAFTRVDGRLVGGAALFGVGWGLAGYCPGPAVVSAGVGVGQAAVFTLSMLGGMALFHAASAVSVPLAPEQAPASK